MLLKFTHYILTEEKLPYAFDRGICFIKSALVQLAASILDNKHQRKRGPRRMTRGRGAALCSGRQRGWIKDEQAPAHRK
jgi:hypothetical protein